MNISAYPSVYIKAMQYNELERKLRFKKLLLKRYDIVTLLQKMGKGRIKGNLLTKILLNVEITQYMMH